ncbi:MAG: butyrate kinase [Peptococcaceae bacterium]|nr:butyrate kinase [Peptococcaceae bacterium]MDH7525063.1 butyrate kinase [Peptococcaceae bacterium]
MMKKERILVINPGSTSTKIAVFEGENVAAEKNIDHDAAVIKKYARVADQLEFRKKAVLDFLQEAGIPAGSLDCVVGRGGLLRPISGGTYLVDEAMCRELQNAEKEHASNLGALISWEIARPLGICSYIADPVVVDEMEPLARLSGLKGIERKSVFHALNQKAVARQAAAALNKGYGECCLIVAHLGGGISVGAHRNGRVIDVNNALDGDGPFSPERAGGMPVCAVIDLCLHSGLGEKEIKKRLVGGGGLVSYLGTNDARKVEAMIREGNEEARLVFEAMAYQVAKEIGSCAAVLKGRVDAVVLTGGLAHSGMLVGWIRERVEFIAPVLVYPGEGEMEALAAAGLRVLRGEEPPRRYEC